MKVAIRADGGPSIGYGHLIRTGALTHKCLQNGDKVLYFTRTPNPVDEELPNDITVVELDENNEVAECLRYVDEYSIDVLFTDSFAVDTKYQKRLSKTEVSLAIRHNFERYTVCCDILVYGDLHAPKLEYEWLETKPKFCLGPDYILLREEFRQAAQNPSVWRDTPEKALIVMGGSDVNNITPTVMKMFDGFVGTVNVVIGPGFTNARAIKRTAEMIDAQFELIFTPENMAEIMQQSDLAVSALGGTGFELLATRTPFVGIPQVDNQQQRAKALEQRDLALIVDDKEDLGESIESLVSSSLRRELYNNIDGVIDGRGAERVYNCLYEFTPP
jgi:UDP-2,4-diacetamido-2,4,6-trideoxy-beta-L-altropyranose hydrolase